MESKVKEKKTAKQRFKIFIKILLIIIAVIAVICGALACISAIGIKENSNFIDSIDAVGYDSQLEPVLDSDGYYSFTTDDDFKILHLTDIHIGAGFLSVKKDTMAINAVAATLLFLFPSRQEPSITKPVQSFLLSLWKGWGYTGLSPSAIMILRLIPISPVRIFQGSIQVRTIPTVCFNQVLRMWMATATT